MQGRHRSSSPTYTKLHTSHKSKASTMHGAHVHTRKQRATNPAVVHGVACLFYEQVQTPRKRAHAITSASSHHGVVSSVNVGKTSTRTLKKNFGGDQNFFSLGGFCAVVPVARSRLVAPSDVQREHFACFQHHTNFRLVSGAHAENGDIFVNQFWRTDFSRRRSRSFSLAPTRKRGEGGGRGGGCEN